MSLFLTQAEIYQILSRELPQDVYAFGPPSAFYTTADTDSTAGVLADAYTNLSTIYNNIFPQTTDENISDWEATAFARPIPALATLTDRQTRVVDKLRLRRGISLWDVLNFVLTYVPIQTFVQIIEYSLPSGGWRLDLSPLDVSTFLGNADDYPNSMFPFSAYAYGIRIYDYTIDPSIYPSFLVELGFVEPARCVHDVQMGLSLASSPYQTVVPNVNRFSGVPLVSVDPTSTETGYTGRTI